MDVVTAHNMHGFALLSRDVRVFLESAEGFTSFAVRALFCQAPCCLALSYFACLATGAQGPLHAFVSLVFRIPSLVNVYG